MSKVQLGKPFPLGSSITARGVNFCVAAPSARHLELLLFSDGAKSYPTEIIDLNQTHKSGDYWHAEVEGIKEGCCYCYRVFHADESNEESFYSDKILIDPCARAITGWDQFKRKDAMGDGINIHSSLRGVVCERNNFDFNSHPRPRHPWEKSIIYELHAGGFTNNKESGVINKKKGTFLGLIDKIPYLKELGITTIELLPVFAFDSLDAQPGLENFWGYSPLNWFTPHPNYVMDKNPLEARNEVRAMVAACHDEGIEVLLDVVYNHTTEGNRNGPTISWRGFDDSLYYYKDKKGNYHDVSGCGNSIAANRPIVRRLIIESMHCWAIELGIDGFRFDLGAALTRGEALTPLENAPLFEEIEADPLLSDLKLISEPWDCGGLYRISDFPSQRVSTWNGRFRDNVRRFWKGDKNTTWPLKDSLRGSPELYKHKKGHTKYSLNFITAHDGFTLTDLVSFDYKHNLANGENNRDGENHNNSWNHGVEGPSSDNNLQIMRQKQKRNLLATLLLSPGLPMILMGDEVGRSQGGNNNTWCQNNPLGWMIWHPEKCDIKLYRFIQKLISIRLELSDFFSPVITTSESKPGILDNDNNDFWLQWHGVKINKPDWGDWSHTISYSINKGNKGSAIWIGLNAYSKSITFELPKPISSWVMVLNTASFSDKNDSFTPSDFTQERIELDSRSLVLMISKEYSSRMSQHNELE